MNEWNSNIIVERLKVMTTMTNHSDEINFPIYHYSTITKRYAFIESFEEISRIKMPINIIQISCEDSIVLIRSRNGGTLHINKLWFLHEEVALYIARELTTLYL